MAIDAAGSTLLGGRQVPRLGFGAMRLPGRGVWGPPADRDAAVAVVRRAYELGVRVIDTAWYYGPDVANEIIVEALGPVPEDLVLVTKLGGARGEDKSWRPALTPDELRAGCERDLRVLGVEAVPVCHLRWMDDAGVSFDAALAAMLDLRDEGKIEHIGLSNVTLDQLDAARDVTPVASVSNPYSVDDRTDEPVLERCVEQGIPYLPFFPLAVGKVARRDPVAQAAAQLGASPVQVALAWLLARSPVIVAIPGTSSVAHLEDNVAAADLALPAGLLP